MNKLIVVALAFVAFFFGRRAEAQTSQCGPEGTAMVPNGHGAMVRVFCDPPVVPAPRPVGTPRVTPHQPVPQALVPPRPPVVVAHRLAPPPPIPAPVLRPPPPVPVVVTAVAQPTAPVVQAPPPPPPTEGELRFYAPQGGSRGQVVQVVISHLWRGMVWADSGPGTTSVPLFGRDREIPRGEDVTANVNVSAAGTSEVRIRVMCGGREGRGGRMLSPRMVRTGTVWALPASECF